MDAAFTVRLIAASAFIAIVLFGLRYLLPVVLRGRAASASGRLISVLESATLATNTGVHVIRVADRFFVVGGGDGHLTLLAEISPESIVPRFEQRAAAMTVSRGPLVDWFEKTIGPKIEADPPERPESSSAIE